MWRQAFQNLKASSAPKLDGGTAVSPGTVAHTPTTALGWRDHFMDQRKAQARTGLGTAIASHLTDDPSHQAAIAGAVANFMGASNGASQG